jgi:hypothetical protein
MPYESDKIPSRVTRQNQDTTLKLLTQNPESTSSTVAGLTVPTGQCTDVAVGQEFTLLARCGIGVDSPAGATTYRTPFFTAKSAPFPFRILQVGFEVVDITVTDFTDGDGGNLDVTVIRGDGAASETESDVLADFALDDDYANGEGAQFPTVAVGFTNNTVVAGGSLYADLVVDPDATSAGTNDGALVDVWVRCLRINTPS